MTIEEYEYYFCDLAIGDLFVCEAKPTIYCIKLEVVELHNGIFVNAVELGSAALVHIDMLSKVRKVKDAKIK